ncbi:rhodanese-like domain-containing protein [Vibrio sp. SCSIO 43135]|uniref:rhodanese-like domain-containing protein n=1 Tax=Vibrio sp. SCSIO 43135 TaxID=2819096 RepID=UPI002074F6C5|nr:rhodanese-like domain-containing protein [Vibrio sp. SCSIO 43135]USD44055.1 rhodanese-like domain-containing protein [Vibrio sp. SCSIO 43135]
MKRVRSICLFILVTLPLGVIASEFPYRSEYPDVKTIELSELRAMMTEVDIVDVRSKLEFDVLHVKGAKHITLSNKGFENKVKKLISNSKAIVFYCNGITCRKSYVAAQRAMAVGVNNVVAFDGGVFSWAEVYPQDSILLGATLDDKNKIISNDKFDEHLLEPSDFKEQASNSETLVVDVRDPIQRDILIFTNVGSRNIPIERFESFLKTQSKDQKIMIYDAVGKQVQWLQYILEGQGYSNYYFMKDGVEGFVEAGLQ